MRFVIALLVASVLSCNSSPTEPNSPIEPQNDAVTVAYGRSVQVSSDLRVTFSDLLEDSRCPSTVQCVWAGNGKIRIDLTTSRGAGSVTLNTHGGNMPREASALGYTFTLLDLQPYPQATEQIPPSQYIATLRITRTS